MLMPKKNRVAIYEHLFKFGVMVSKKDFTGVKHPKIEVPNLHVIKALQNLKSHAFVKEQFAWRHYYWYLTNEGIQYLCDFLHLTSEIVHATLKRQTYTEASRGPRPKAPESVRGGSPTDREYRRAPANMFGDKKADVGAGSSTDFQFRARFDRGRPQQQK